MFDQAITLATNAQPVLTALRDLFAIIVAISGILAARKWLTSTRGEAAKRLMHATYRLRKAIIDLRDTQLNPNEFERAFEFMERVGKPLDSKSEGNRWAALYMRRWYAIESAKHEFDEAAFAAEVVWGPRVYKVVIPIWDLMRNLWNAIAEYVDGVHDGKNEYDEDYRRASGIVKGDPDDKYTERLLRAVQDVESFLRAFLGRRLGPFGWIKNNWWWWTEYGFLKKWRG